MQAEALLLPRAGLIGSHINFHAIVKVFTVVLPLQPMKLDELLCF